MAEKTYTLAKAMLQKDDPEFVKTARQESKPTPENLERRRLDFQQEYKILKALIERIQSDNAKLHETKEVNERQTLQDGIAAFSNLANLQALAGLYEGFALLADLLSIRVIKRDEKTGKAVLTEKGEKIYIRVPILYDLGADLEEMDDTLVRIHNLAFKVALKAGVVYVGQRGVDPAVKDAPGEVLAEEAPAGVPESDLKAASAQPTAEQVEKFVKG